MYPCSATRDTENLYFKSVNETVDQYRLRDTKTPFLHKPFSPEVLCRVVAELVASRLDDQVAAAAAPPGGVGGPKPEPIPADCDR